jgi:hypothetical protein
MSNAEIFKDVAGYDRLYAVSDMGRVKSLGRTVRRRNGTIAVRECILKPQVRPDGYLEVGLHAKGKQRAYKVHKLVAAAFIGPCPDGQQCCHSDGNPANNAVSNLRYDTPAGNNADKLLHGTSNRGVRHSRNKLTEAQVLCIRADTRSQRIVAAEYGIHWVTVSAIRLRKKWAWLQPDEPQQKHTQNP